MRFNSKQALYTLNFVQIDLQQGNITESEAERITDEIAKGMIVNATYYKRAKKEDGGQRLTYYGNRETYESRYDETICLICGRRSGATYSCDSCYENYKREFIAKKFPNKLKEIINKFYEIYPNSDAPTPNSNAPYNYYDWRYLNLIAKDLERGYIEKPEALSEAERYIDLIYNDIKGVLEELAAKKNAPPKPVVKTESEKFMDDILS